MKLHVFAIRDIAINAFDRPFCVTHLGQAERAFRDACTDPQSNLAKHPEDYELYQLGTFDDGTGVFEVGQPVQISTGKAVVHARSMSSVPDERSAVGLKS